jgi:hypothetical protein
MKALQKLLGTYYNTRKFFLLLSFCLLSFCSLAASGSVLAFIHSMAVVMDSLCKFRRGTDDSGNGFFYD